MSSGENVSASIEKNKLLNSLFLKPPVHNTETTVFFFFFKTGFRLFAISSENFIALCLLMVGWLVGWLVGGLKVLSSTFNNISVISWLSVSLVKETGICRENHRHVASH